MTEQDETVVDFTAPPSLFIKVAKARHRGGWELLGELQLIG